MKPTEVCGKALSLNSAFRETRDNRRIIEKSRKGVLGQRVKGTL